MSHNSSGLYASYTSLLLNNNKQTQQHKDSQQHSTPLQQLSVMPTSAAVQVEAGNPSNHSSNPATCNVTDFVRAFDTKLYVKSVQPTSASASPSPTNLHFAGKGQNFYPPPPAQTCYQSANGKLVWKSPKVLATAPTFHHDRSQTAPASVMQQNLHFSAARNQNLEFEHSTLV